MDRSHELPSQDDAHAYPPAVGDYICDPDFLKIGGYGMVFRGRHVDDPNRVVAIKFLKADYAKIASARRRFIEEGRILEQLRHDNCIRVHETDEQDGIPYLVMDFIDGRDAREMTPSGGLNYRTAVGIVIQAARGLHHAHTRESPIIHRDVKPSNLLYDPRTGRAVVTDFGLAKRLFDPEGTSDGDGLTPLTPFGTSVRGTPYYTPPEYIDPPEHGNVIGPRGDIYSLGATLYELLAGRPPFPRDGVLDGGSGLRAVAEIKHKHRPHALPRRVPESIRRICARAMHRRPAARHASAGELADVLEATLPPVDRPPGRWHKAAIAVGLVATTAATVALTRRGLGERDTGDATPRTSRPSTHDDLPLAVALEAQALDAYDEAKHPEQTVDVRFAQAGPLFDRMRDASPRFARGRITYLNVLMDYCRPGSGADAPNAAKTALTVLAELDGLTVNDPQTQQEISVYRSYFSVYKDDTR